MIQKPAVLFITLDGLTDPLGQSQILPYLCGLSKVFKIGIISCEKEKNYLKNAAKINEITAEYGIQWRHTPYESTIPIYSQYNNIKRLERLAKEWATEESFSIFHCRSLIPAIIGNSLRNERGGKLLFDMRGFWADERVEGNIWSLKNPLFKQIYRYFKKKENELIKSADHIITLTQNAKDFILKEYGIRDKIDVIPCCVDTEKFYFPRDLKKKQQLRKDLQIADQQVVLLYLGSLGTRYELGHMLRFFKEFKLYRQDAIFLFVTNTDPELIYKQLSALQIPKSSIRITSASSEEVPDYINLANASIYFIKNGYTAKAVSPTKQAEALIMEVPVIANSGIGDTDQFIKEHQIGVMVEKYDTAHFREVAQKFLKGSFKKSELRNFALEHLSLQRAVSTYSAVYNQLTDR